MLVSFCQANSTFSDNFCAMMQLPVDSPDTSAPDTIAVDTLKIDQPKDKPLKARVIHNSADSSYFDLIEQKMYLYGEAMVEYEDNILKANYIEFSFKDKIVFAEVGKDSLGNEIGKPDFTGDGQNFKGSSINYNFETKKGVIKDVVTQEGDGTLHGKTIKKHANDHVHVKDGKYTTCEHEDPHFYLKLSKAIVIPNDKIVSGPGYLVVGDVPTPLFIPFGYFPNKRGKAAGILIPEPGESPTLGFYLINGGYYVPIGDKVDMQIRGDFYSRGSWGLKNFVRYKNIYRYNGDVNVSYSILKQSDPEFPDFSLIKNFFVNWRHNQDPKARPNSKFSANVNVGTNTNFRNNFNSTTNNYLTNTFQSNIAYTKTWAGKPYSLSTNLRHSQNTQSRIVNATLPEMAFNVSRIYPLAFLRQENVGSKKWFEKIGLSYNTNFKNEISVADTLINMNNLSNLTGKFRNGLKHSATANTSMKFLKYFTLTPAFNYTERWYVQTIEKNWDDELQTTITDTLSGFKTARDYSISANVTTKYYMTYQYKKGPIQAIRHVFTPNVGFTYIPDLSSEVEYTINDTTLDAPTVGTYSPFDQGIYGKPNANEAGLVTFNFINNLEMKVRTPKDTASASKKVRLIENFNFSSSYDLFKDSLNWSNVRLNARTKLFKNLNLNYTGTLNPYAFDSLGNNINTSMWKQSKKLGTITNSTFALGWMLKSPGSGTKESNKGTQEELDAINANPNAYVDFNIPWSLNINYNIRLNRSFANGIDTTTITQSLTFNGDFNLTKYWKIGVNSGYDFETKDLTYTQVNIYRDLHCWELRFNWIPFGFRKSYGVTLSVKSPLLQDLKLQRKRAWYDLQ